MSEKNEDLILKCLTAIRYTDTVFICLEDMMSKEGAKFHRKQWKLLRKILIEYLEREK